MIRVERRIVPTEPRRVLITDSGCADCKGRGFRLAGTLTIYVCHCARVIDPAADPAAIPPTGTNSAP